MSLLRTAPRFELPPILLGDRVLLRYPQMSDFESWSDLREQSRGFLTPWEPTWPPDDLTRPAFRRRLRRYAREAREDTSYAFFVFDRDKGPLLGGCTLSNVRRGVAQACSLGYWMGEPFAGKGLMRDAVRALIPFVFDRLGMHRLEAACLPSNERSTRLLLGLGFKQEGLARKFLKINGAWQDHLLFALLDDDRRGR
jgi:ribosomal-protein-alanine N-acetyltransferase